MPLTPTNQVKNVMTPTYTRKGLGAYWGDLDATWGDDFYTWGEGESFINQSKNVMTPSNQTKN